MSNNQTIEQFMNQGQNQNYREIRFYNTGFGDITHDELDISKYGAIHLSRGNAKTVYPPVANIYIDEINRKIILGDSNSYDSLEFKYNSSFYI